MLSVVTYMASSLPQMVAQDMLPLTKEGSAHSQWLSSIAAGAKNPDIPDDLVYAVCHKDEDFNLEVVGWTSLFVWEGMPAIEGYVAEDQRGRKVASMLAVAVVIASRVPKYRIATFSDECEAIGKWLGFEEVARFRRVDDGWVRSR